MTLQPAQNGGLLLVNDPHQRVMFDTWPDIQDQKSSNWVMIPIIGRSEPIPVYQSSDARRINLKLRLAATASLNPLQGTSEVFEMKGRLDFLKSLVYPDKKGSFHTHPPLVWLICGDHINVKAFANSVNVTYVDVPWEAVGDEVTRPMVADVNIQLTIVNDFGVTADTVRNAGDNYQDIHGSKGGALK
jgi:hypothetical protein